ncbi:hypothetical protein [uncultured Devosia sp.]
MSERAAEILDKERVPFKPRNSGDVFAPIYMSNYVEPDGTPASGFQPG